jgi:hypothetical protein
MALGALGLLEQGGSLTGTTDTIHPDQCWGRKDHGFLWVTKAPFTLGSQSLSAGVVLFCLECLFTSLSHQHIPNLKPLPEYGFHEAASTSPEAVHITHRSSPHLALTTFCMVT